MDGGRERKKKRERKKEEREATVKMYVRFK